MPGLAEELLVLVNAYEQNALALFATVPSASVPQTALDTLSKSYHDLAQAANTVPRHQANQKRIEACLNAVREYDRHWKADVEAALAIKAHLEELLEQGRQDVKRIRLNRKSELRCVEKRHRPDFVIKPDPTTPDDILALARQLAPFTSAPPSSDPDTQTWPPDIRALMARGGVPPFPTEEVMRRGLLGAMDAEHQDQATIEQPTAVPHTGVDQGDESMQEDHPVQAAVPRKPREQPNHDDFAFDLDLNPDLDF